MRIRCFLQVSFASILSFFLEGKEITASLFGCFADQGWEKCPPEVIPIRVSHGLLTVAMDTVDMVGCLVSSVLSAQSDLIMVAKALALLLLGRR